MRDFRNEIKNTKAKLDEIDSSFKDAKKFTAKLLKECAVVGITRVSVGKRTSKIPRTEQFPFGCSGSIFQYPEGTKDRSGWPSIWGVVSRLGISGGAGNADQHQVKGSAPLIEGVFELKGNAWRWIE